MPLLSKKPLLTPLRRQEPLLTTLAFRLDVVKAVIAGKTYVSKKSRSFTSWRLKVTWSMKFFPTKSCWFQSIFPAKSEDTDVAWNVGLILVALLMSVNMSWPAKTTVRRVFWARVLCSLAAEAACFRMRITLGVVLIRSLVFHVCVP